MSTPKPNSESDFEKNLRKAFSAGFSKSAESASVGTPVKSTASSQSSTATATATAAQKSNTALSFASTPNQKPSTLTFVLGFQQYTHVLYSTKPIRKSKSAVPIGAEKFGQEYCNIEWCDSLITSIPGVKPLVGGKAKMFTGTSKCVNSLAKRMLQTFNNLVICEMHPLVGKGVFSNVNQGVIPKFTVVEVFGGVLEPAIHATDLVNGIKDCYSMVWNSVLKEQIDATFSCIKALLSTNSSTIGNHARFFQDAPSQEELDEMENPAHIKANIAPANCQISYAVINGVPVTYIFAREDIPGGAPMTYSYSVDDWFGMRGMKRYVTDRDGEIVGYIDKKGNEKKRIIFDYPERFVKDVNGALGIFLKIYSNPKKKGEAKNYLDRLNTAFNPDPNNAKITAEDRFIAIQELLALKDKQKLLDTELNALKQKLERAMEGYIAGRKVECLSIPTASLSAAAVDSATTSSKPPQSVGQK